MRGRIGKSVFWLVWSRGFIQVVSLVTTLVIARFLDPSAYGLMALATVWSGLLILICELGLGAAVIQFPDLEEAELNVCFFVINAAAWLAYLALYAAAPNIGGWFNSPGLSPVLRVTGLVLLIQALCSVHDALLRKRLRFDCLAKADMAAAAIGIPVVFVMAYKGLGVWALVAGMVCKGLVGMLMVFWYERWLPGLAFKLDRFREILNFSLASFGSRALWAAYDQSDALVLGKISGEVNLGYYTMARDLASLPVVRISSVVNQLAVPVMAELQADREAMRKTLLRGIRMVWSVSVPLCIGTILVAEDAVRLLLTEKWIPIVPVLQILCISALIKSVDILVPPVLRARYRAGFLVGYNTLLLIVMPVAFLVGALWAGSVGVAAAWAVVYPIAMLWMVREAIREINLGWSTLLRQMIMPLVAATGMSVAVVGVQHAFAGQIGSIVLIRLIASVAGGAIAYGIILWFWGGQITAELRELVQWVFRPRSGAPNSK